MRFTTPPPSAGLRSQDPAAFKHARTKSHPMRFSSRIKPRRWPLVLRFIKGAVHGMIIVPILFHATFAAAVLCLDKYYPVALPNSLIPSLSIVVGLMLVFRNQTSWNRFWNGRNEVTKVTSCVRNLARVFLTCSYLKDQHLDAAERADIDRTTRILIAIPYAVKNHLRAEWGAAFAPAANKDIEQGLNHNITPRLNANFENLLPAGLKGHEDEGLGLPLQLTFMVEAFVTRGVDRGWFTAPGASQLTSQICGMVDAYGKMETIRITPMPIAHLIHQKQVLAIYCCVLPFALVDSAKWWTILVVVLVTFTLYGIEGIGCQLEDPFGHDRNDIKMDAIVEDTRVEVLCMLEEWKRTVYHSEQNSVKGEMFYDAVAPNPPNPGRPHGPA